jgi:hypothetical protein
MCSDQVIGLSVTTGLFAAASIASWVYSCWIRPFRNQPCPYCATSLPPAAIREHLQTCTEHAKHYIAKGQSSRRLLNEFFYVNHPQSK